MSLMTTIPRAQQGPSHLPIAKKAQNNGTQRKGLQDISNQVTKRQTDQPQKQQGSDTKACDINKLCTTFRSHKLGELGKPFISKKTVIEDIDKAHEDNLFLVHDYAKDVYKYLMELENRFAIEQRPLQNSKITEVMRTILVDWLLDVHVEFQLLQETIHIAVSILDRYIQANTSIEKNMFQLVGVCALSIASKYEEMFPPGSDDFLYLCKNAYDRNQLMEMEKKILISLTFDLGRPVSIIFLRRFNMAAKAHKLQHCYSKFIVDMALLETKLCHIRPSLVAAAAVFIAMCIVNGHTKSALWTPTMVYYSLYKFDDLKPVTSILANLVLSNFNTTYDSIRRKYSTSSFMSVSMKMVTSAKILKEIAVE